MKVYNSTPAKWLSFFVYLMMILLMFCILIITFTNQIDKFKIGETNYQYPIQSHTYLSKYNAENDSLFSDIKNSPLNIAKEEKYNAELNKVKLQYRLDKDHYFTLHISYKLFFIIFLSVIIYQLNLFRKVLQNVKNKNPFSDINVKLLRKAAYIGLVMILLELIFSLLFPFYIKSLFNYQMFLSSYPFPEFYSVNLISVIFFFMVAEILKLGINYKTENELTV